MGNKTFQTKEDFNPTPYMKYPRHVQDISTPVKLKTFQPIINKDISTPVKLKTFQPIINKDISTPVKIKTFQLIINKDISTPSNIISSYLITYKLQDFWTDGQTDG